MGGNRVSTAKWIRNIAVVWLLTGIWHGAEWNFVLWGVFFGIILVLEKFLILKILNKAPSFVSRIYTIFILLVSFAIFNANGLDGVASDISGMFGRLRLPAFSSDTAYNLKNYLGVFIVALLGATPMPKHLWKKLPYGFRAVAEPILATVLLIFSTALLINGSFNPFLYFRF
jgi:alginate O-acetyltransferase complex protein AlgI